MDLLGSFILGRRNEEVNICLFGNMSTHAIQKGSAISTALCFVILEGKLAKKIPPFVVCKSYIMTTTDGCPGSIMQREISENTCLWKGSQSTR